MEEFRFLPLRMESIRLRDIQIINDCYNINSHKEKCIKYILRILSRGDIILIKGSREMKMEEIADYII